MLWRLLATGSSVHTANDRGVPPSGPRRNLTPPRRSGTPPRMSDDFDATPYVRPPILDVPSAVALGIALLTAMPKAPPDNVKKAAKKLHKDVVALQAAWAKADALPAPPDKRKADMRTDNAWGVFLDRLEAYARLPVEHYPKAARARELVDTISPDREWLKLPYEAEWAESGKRIKRIDKENLATDCDALAGPEFLHEVRQAHKGYGEALGVTKPAQEGDNVNLADPLRAVSRAIARYGVAVAGMADDDDATLALMRKALRPIDDFRDAQAKRASSGGSGGESSGGPNAPAPASPTTPVPEPK